MSALTSPRFDGSVVSSLMAFSFVDGWTSCCFRTGGRQPCVLPFTVGRGQWQAHLHAATLPCILFISIKNFVPLPMDSNILAKRINLYGRVPSSPCCWEIFLCLIVS